MRTKVLVLPVLLLGTGAALADGGHNHGHGAKYEGHAAAMGEPGDPRARGIRTIEVTMTDKMRFQPATLTVKRGETIRFVVKNQGETRHELTLGTPDELIEHAKVMQKFPEMVHDEPNAVSVEPGKTGAFLWKFTKTGNWDLGFACLIPGHFEAGMKGRVIVR